MDLDIECLSREIARYCKHGDWCGLDRVFSLIEHLNIDNTGAIKAKALCGAITVMRSSDQALANHCEYIIYKRKLPSVSEILGSTRSQSQRENQDHNLNPSNDLDKHHARTRGTRLHQLVNDYLRGLNRKDDFYDVDDLRSSISPIVSAVRNTVYKDFVEKSVIVSLDPDKNQDYGLDFGYSGRLDCVAHFENKLCLFEWKTSQLGELTYDIERSAIQAASYVWALRETYNIAIEGIVIAVAIPREPAKVFYFWPEQIEVLIDKFKYRLKAFSRQKSVIKQVLGYETRPGITISNPDQSTFRVSSYPRLGSRGLVSYKADTFSPSHSATRILDNDFDQEEFDCQDTQLYLTEEELLSFISPNGNLCLSYWPEDEDIYQSGWEIPGDVKRSKLEAQIIPSCEHNFCDFSAHEEDRQENYSEVVAGSADSAESANNFIGDAWLSLIDETDRLAKDFYIAGQFSQAESLFLDALEKKLRFLEPKHPSIIFSLDDLASTYISKGYFQAAGIYFLDALSLRRKLFSSPSIPIIQNLIDLAHIYFLQQRYCDSKIVYLSALINMIDLFGESHPQVMSVMDRVKVIQQYITYEIEL